MITLSQTPHLHTKKFKTSSTEMTENIDKTIIPATSTQPYSQNIPTTQTHNTKNFMVMSVGMFLGANLNKCTINITLPK